MVCGLLKYFCWSLLIWFFIACCKTPSHQVMMCCELGDARAYSYCFGFERVSITSACIVPSIFEDHTAGCWNCSGKIETVES